MILVDLYLPDDLPIDVDAELGQSLAAFVEGLPDSRDSDGCMVYVHRLPVYGVVTATREGVRAVRVHVAVSQPLPSGLPLWLRELVGRYLHDRNLEHETEVVVQVAPLEMPAPV
ncbi:hypothetical protein ABIE44_002688 [Marmoricola sp. OAE513]|uniref:hypothetical protein n=1 Tax=Marmoricola sp. OAE513 TaxID=2817894 RepID=UPI001AE97A5F